MINGCDEVREYKEDELSLNLGEEYEKEIDETALDSSFGFSCGEDSTNSSFIPFGFDGGGVGRRKRGAVDLSPLTTDEYVVVLAVGLNKKKKVKYYNNKFLHFIFHFDMHHVFHRFFGIFFHILIFC